MIKQTHLYILYLLVIVCFLISSNVYANKSVLVVHSYHEEHAWTQKIKKGIDNTLDKLNEVVVYHEYMDTKRYPLFAHKTAFLSYLQSKYTSTLFDAIMVSDDAALTLFRQEHVALFENMPVVYLGINKVDNEVINTPNMTGVFENRDISSAVVDIKILTKVDELIVITDTSKAGQANLSKLEMIKNDAKSPSKIHIIVDLKPDQILEKLRSYSPTIPIFSIGQLVDSSINNALLSWDEGTLALTSKVSNPVFTLASTSIKHGALGVSELNGEKHGEQGALYVRSILEGSKVSELTPKIKAKSVWTFNWQLMKRYHYPIERLPLDSQLINKDETFYEKYKLLVLGAISLFIVALLVIGLLIELVRRGRQTQAILTDNENRYKQLAQAGANVFWEIDTEHKVTYLSGNTLALIGKPINQLIGQYFSDIFKNESISEFPLAKAKNLLNCKFPIEHFIFKRKIARDKVKVLVINGAPMFNKLKQYTGYRGICNDVTIEHHLTEKLAYQAEHDSLTGLINRERFLLRLKKEIKKAPKISSFICFLDLDRFKLVNDTAGHLVGDAMLTKIAGEISSCIESDDILGRFGGDEFGLLLINKSQAQALALCENIVKKINHFHFQWNDKKIAVGMSIGMVPLDRESSEIELLSKADMSCYKAKDLGRNRVYFADPNNSELHTESIQMGYIANITQAIKNDQFYLVKQAIASAKPDDSHLHYEILLRFKDDYGVNISPASFIPAAEKYGVITLIDYWVVRNVFENYNNYFPSGTLVSINLSGLSLSNEEFIKKLTTLVRDSSIDCRNICFEITETAVISNLSSALVFIAQMKELGIKFALDDFGSGASSFGYLKQLPVDYLKIDGSLVQNMLCEPVDRAIIKSIHEVARMMNMHTIAEFVENDELRVALADMGIDLVQGYGIGKPIPCELIT